MKITDQVIAKFFGEGRGFTMIAIKRWGGFIKTEDELEWAHYRAIVSAISAKDREIEFDDEVHMVNYLMRCCYWGLCDYLKNGNRVKLVLESDMMSEDDSDNVRWNLLEPTCEIIDLTEKSQYTLSSQIRSLVLDKFGEEKTIIYDRLIAGHAKIKDVAIELNRNRSWVDCHKRTIERYLRFKLKGLAQDFGHFRKPKVRVQQPELEDS